MDATFQSSLVLPSSDEVEIDLEEAPGADEARFVAPGAPRSAFFGVRLTF